MHRIHRLATLCTTALVALSLLAVPASAKKPPRADEETFPARIDCGDGPLQVTSTADLWAPLVDDETGEKLRPIAWKVSGDGFAVDETNGKPNKHATTCAYDDGIAKGTVTLKKAPKGH